MASPAVLDTAVSMSKVSSLSGNGTGNGYGLLDARLAKSTLFRDKDPCLRTVPTTTNPAPLGFFSFAFCGLLYMGILTSWLPHESVCTVYAFFFTFAGVGELIVGLLEYSRKNVFACNAFLCYSFFWIGFALKGTMQVAQIWPKSAKADQMAFILYGFITVAFWVQTLLVNAALSLLFFSLSILFFLLAAEQTNKDIANSVGGFGVFVCIVAFYNGAAILCHEMYGKELLPMFHFNWQKIGVKLRSTSVRFGTTGTHRIVVGSDVV